MLALSHNYRLMWGKLVSNLGNYLSSSWKFAACVPAKSNSASWPELTHRIICFSTNHWTLESWFVEWGFQRKETQTPQPPGSPAAVVTVHYRGTLRALQTEAAVYWLLRLHLTWDSLHTQHAEWDHPEAHTHSCVSPEQRTQRRRRRRKTELWTVKKTIKEQTWAVKWQPSDISVYRRNKSLLHIPICWYKVKHRQDGAVQILRFRLVQTPTPVKLHFRTNS